MKNLLFKKYNLITVLLCFVFYGCSSDPGASEGKRILENQINSQSNGYIKLLNFEKTNGIKLNASGRDVYELEYSALLEFQKEGWKTSQPFGGFFSDFIVHATKPEGWDAVLSKSKHYNKGHKVNLTGKMTFEKTENGWRSTN